MPAADSPEPIGTVLLILLLVPLLGLSLGLLPWIVWQYVKAWRTRGERRPAGDMAWLRAMYPDHEALPTPTRRAPMLPTPRGWTAGRVLIYAAQAGAIGWLTWLIGVR